MTRQPQVVDSAYGTTRSSKKVYLKEGKREKLLVEIILNGKQPEPVSSLVGKCDERCRFLESTLFLSVSSLIRRLTQWSVYEDVLTVFSNSFATLVPSDFIL